MIISIFWPWDNPWREAGATSEATETMVDAVGRGRPKQREDWRVGAGDLLSSLNLTWGDLSPKVFIVVPGLCFIRMKPYSGGLKDFSEVPQWGMKP